MTSSSEPASLAGYLVGHGFRPNASHGTWLDRGTGQGIIRVVCEPGEGIQLISLAPRSVCLYKIVFNPGTPDAVITAALQATLGGEGR